MSMTPPPGWYRDPSYPLVERWWDGAAWTDHRRQPEQPVPIPVSPAGQDPQLAPQSAAEPRRSGGPKRAKAVALATAAVVLVAAIVTGAVVLGRDDDGGGAEARTTTAAASDSKDASPSPSASASKSAQADDPSTVVDDLNGITLALPDGWVRPENVAEDDLVMITPGTYDCPGDPGLCRRGRVFSRTVTSNDEKSPKALAENDIEDAANDTYDRGVLDERPYSGIKSHQVVKSGSVAVGGRAGYFVRWQVTTGAGPGGYVESLAFASTVGSQSMILVRFAFDAGADGPPVSDMDRITKGIKPVGDAAGSSGGVGSSIGTGR
ncbi:DUF2510 domain-containing protein [Streptomyces sp. NPDC059785]|uniref:DUF2510 domain-containing protein n=1 Tax=Streptomyces sp. NPDC059785 TaxID=3346945 RepID=UPI0036689279